jgi:hypothetical protein
MYYFLKISYNTNQRRLGFQSSKTNVKNICILNITTSFMCQCAHYFEPVFLYCVCVLYRRI